MVENENVQIRRGEKEVENVNVEYDESTVRTELLMSVGPAEGEQVIVRVVAAQVEQYHPKRRQPHRELHRWRQDEEAR